MQVAELARARDALQQVSGLETVTSLTIDGLSMLAALELDFAEHTRRERKGIGAVTCKALLHGLWLLPSGGAVGTNALPENKVKRLRDAPHVATESAGCITRTYSPPGVLRAVAFAGRCVERTVGRAARFTPIVQRYVLIEQDTQQVPQRVECVAREWGVGIVGMSSHARVELVVPADAAAKGVPSVYRWWVAELAYERFLYENTQLVSCGLGFSGP